MDFLEEGALGLCAREGLGAWERGLDVNKGLAGVDTASPVQRR